MPNDDNKKHKTINTLHKYGLRLAFIQTSALLNIDLIDIIKPKFKCRDRLLIELLELSHGSDKVNNKVGDHFGLQMF